MAALLEHYGLIGDSSTVALVSRAGSIDWLCLPRFDSDACFAGLLGHDDHGSWAIRPVNEVEAVRQRYRPDTLVLETEVTCRGGRARVIDFMPLAASEKEHDIIRIVEGLEGEVPMHLDLKVRFAYGRLIPWIQVGGHRATLVSGPDALAFRSAVPIALDADDARLECDFVVRAGEQLPFTLEYYPSHHAMPDRAIDTAEALARTERQWSEWARGCRYQGPHRDAVVRSLITLKALTHAPTGGIVAAPTTSLPEELGGVRNWDYRYCWLRDSALTLDALMLGGSTAEARAWSDWLLRAAAGAPAEMQIMYGIAGEHRLTEVELPWLPGYEDSHPVRIGNGAYDQFQLDIYGEMLNTMYEARVHGAVAGVPWEMLTVVTDFVEKVWKRPDKGIWEIRGKDLLHFTHSKLMAWVAVDRAVRFLEQYGETAPAPTRRRLYRWRALRAEIRAEIMSRGFHAQVGAFTQSYGSTALDASVLLMPHMGFLPAGDPKMLSTVAAIEKGLTWDGFVLRYATDTGVDGLPGHEATFLICSFWLVDNYTLAGRLDDAARLLERLVSLCNEVGLLAEEYHPGLHRQLGNFPQAFSHVGLINSAFLLEAVRAGRQPYPAALAA
ncbi:MAG: glycoside hydrolase family 15 protein [Deltaproteobacteria bacterium]|nr:glycoside hydrolase family 15 protein [Deltaproteobacteria bacterium]